MTYVQHLIACCASQASKSKDAAEDIAPNNRAPADGEPEISWRGTRTGQ